MATRIFRKSGNQIFRKSGDQQDFPLSNYNKYNCSITPIIWINWDREPSGYAENPDNWILL
jgi:hypothetical protein